MSENFQKEKKGFFLSRYGLHATLSSGSGLHSLAFSGYMTWRHRQQAYLQNVIL